MTTEPRTINSVPHTLTVSASPGVTLGATCSQCGDGDLGEWHYDGHGDYHHADHCPDTCPYHGGDHRADR